jgi:tripartite-type tricarboxylate transporter receptor subunit TctC
VKILNSIGLMLGLVLGSSASGQAAYPSAPLRIIVPHATGGAADALSRGLAERLALALGQPVIVDNRPGANGIIGAGACAKAPADGYTLCMTNNDVISLNPFLYAKLPYDPARDFAPVVHVANVTGMIVANASVPASSMKEFVALAKARPGTLKWGSFGVGSIGHVYVEWLQRTAGVSILHVPYKGAGPTVPAVLSGEVDAILFAAGGAAPYITSGKVKPLAMLGSKRLASMPDVPTFGEQGFPFYVNPWVGLFAPAGTPKEIVQRLNIEVNRILADPAFRERTLAPQTAEAVGGSTASFAAFIRADREESAKGVKLSGIQLD